jgi:hypothetical protein
MAARHCSWVWYIHLVDPFGVLAHHWVPWASPGVARAIMPAMNAIEVATRVNLRISAGTSKANANRAFEFDIIASVLWVSVQCAF